MASLSSLPEDLLQAIPDSLLEEEALESLSRLGTISRTWYRLTGECLARYAETLSLSSSLPVLPVFPSLPSLSSLSRRTHLLYRARLLRCDLAWDEEGLAWTVSLPSPRRTQWVTIRRDAPPYARDAHRARLVFGNAVACLTLVAVLRACPHVAPCVGKVVFGYPNALFPDWCLLVFFPATASHDDRVLAATHLCHLAGGIRSCTFVDLLFSHKRHTVFVLPHEDEEWRRRVLAEAMDATLRQREVEWKVQG